MVENTLINNLFNLINPINDFVLKKNNNIYKKNYYFYIYFCILGAGKNIPTIIVSRPIYIC